MASKLIPFLDVTTLQEADTKETIRALLTGVIESRIPPAAICILPRWWEAISTGVVVPRSTADALKQRGIRRATVLNFPHGQVQRFQDLSAELEDLLGRVQEVDVVFPYRAYLDGQLSLEECRRVFLEPLVRRCHRSESQQHIQVKVKLILETSAFHDHLQLASACRMAVEAGVDFLKTSTGFHPAGGATVEAVQVMAEAVQDCGALDRVGIKVSGGIRTCAQAQEYFEVVQRVYGEARMDPQHFRIGASSLFTQLQRQLQEQPHESQEQQ